METSADFERRVRARYNIKSDYAFAKLIGLTRSAVSARVTSDRPRVFGEEAGRHIAELLDLDPAYVLSCLAAERAKRPELKLVWERIAHTFEQTGKKVAKVSIVLIGLLLLPPFMSDAGASMSHPVTLIKSDLTRYTLCVFRRLRRRLRAWLARFALGLTLLAGAAAPAAAADPWRDTDTALGAVHATVFLIDWGQTRYGARHPERFIETNGFLSRHPSIAEVDRYFAVSALLQFGIAHALPADWRTPWQLVFIAQHGSAALRNHTLSVRVDF